MRVIGDPERARWRDTWRTTVCEAALDGGWLDLAHALASGPTLLITAWNPDGAALAPAVNQRRDAVLHDELSARGLSPRRARGRDPGGSWSEDGWAVPCDREAAVELLRRFGQLAGFVFDRGGRGLLWRDGAFEWLEAPP
jgi:hypothetical protein